MWSGFPLFPESASSLSGRVDALFFWLLGLASLFTMIIFVSLAYFAIRYRRRSDDDRPPEETEATPEGMRLEIAWTVIPLVLALVTYVWAARLYMEQARPPDQALDVYVVARQWMWKFQHLDGRREINELHVPVGRPVRLTMASQDVIHSFFVPAFRVKADVVPGRFNSVWFEATKAGEYHLFCAEYCGTLHSGMRGRVVALLPEAYENWLGGGGGASMVESGAQVFQRLGCATCHRSGSGARGPILDGLLGRRVRLRDGRVVVADEAYLRQSILEPASQVVAGYEPIMPAFRGQISEEALLQLLAYIRSRAGSGEGPAPPAAGPAGSTR